MKFSTKSAHWLDGYATAMCDAQSLVRDYGEAAADMFGALHDSATKAGDKLGGKPGDPYWKRRGFNSYVECELCYMHPAQRWEELEKIRATNPELLKGTIYGQ